MKDNEIRHYIGGVITFIGEDGQSICSDWYSYGKQIITPDVPEKPADSNYEYTISWEPVPDICTGNQTIRLCYIANRIGDNIQGDFTGDGKVNNLDVEFLLWHTLFPENYPIESNADFNSDNEISNLDVEYLLWHTLFPETYPI